MPVDTSKLDNFLSLQDLLETAIDKHTLATVLNAIATVCYEKCDHVQGNWNDRRLATCWRMTGARVSKTADYARGMLP